MSEPMNPEHFYVMLAKMEIDGKKGYAKIKKWYDENGKLQEKVLNFEEDK